MFSGCLPGLQAIAAALIPLAVACTTPALGSDRVDARFEIFGFAGLHVLTNLMSTEETAHGYAIAMDLDTRGLASAFVDLKSHSEVQGTLAGEVLRPAAYQAQVKRNGADRYYGLKYLNDGAIIDSSAPPPTERAHLDAAHVRGTVDQLTAYFLLERQLARSGFCRLVVPVFDGSELYRLHFSDVGEETLSPDRYQGFAGPTRVCDIVREMIVANPDKLQGTYQHGKVWYASLLPHHQMIPVRMEYDTVIGSVEGYLAELTGQGVHLHLMGE
ncbi:MAG TPA: DUF3108 domain-containing protein [Stellaceae bacterium]|jgi:hypothetical protein|nr:DUF3108 domain-containing protein [Stellaceae bacterium]